MCLSVHPCPQAIQSVMSAEISLYDELKMGMDTYVEPLRDVLSESSHRTIFLNLDQVS